MNSIAGGADVGVVEQVREWVRTLIVEKNLKRGDQLPSYRQMAADLRVGYTTVKFAMDELEAQGVVQRQAARGCYVARELSRTGQYLQKLGILFPGTRHRLFSTPYVMEIMRGITTSDGLFHDLHLFSFTRDGLISAGKIAEHGVDGVLLLGIENEAYLHAFASWRIPGVVVDYHTTNAALDCVVCDNAGGARQAIRHVLEGGHRRILYVAGGSKQSVSLEADSALPFALESSDRTERREAVLDMLRAAPAVQWQVALVDGDAASFMSAWDRAAAAWSEPPTAVVTDDDATAAVVFAELAQRGLRAPEDVSVCAVAMADTPMLGDRPLTGCRFNFTGMGQEAIRLLLRRYQNPSQDRTVTHRIGFEWVDGETCAARA